MAGIPVVIATNGIGLPVRPVDASVAAPLMTTAPNGIGAPIVISDNGTPFIVEDGVTPITPVPGPLDYIENGQNKSSITVPYDLARPVAMLGVAFRHTGPVTSLTATHGGQPLTLVSFILNPDDNIGAAAFVGNGLTIEVANLVITPVGGTIGPAVVRIDDSFAISTVQVGPVGSQFGYSYIGAGTQPAPVVLSPSTGEGWGVYALAASSAEKESYARGLNGASPISRLFWGVASSGTLKLPPAWTGPGAGWVQNGAWWEHTGASSYLTGDPLTPAVVNPFWWEVEIDVAEGARLYVQTVGAGGYLSETFLGPISGTVRRYRSQNYNGSRFQMQALGTARFRNFKYCDDGMTVFGAFGRTTNKIPNNASLQFQIGALSRYAGIAMEVHNA